MIATMRRLVPIVAFLATLVAAVVPAGASAALETMHLKRGVEVQALAAGPNGTLWAAGVDHADQPERNFLIGMSPEGKPLRTSTGPRSRRRASAN
jgi:hypothetical protein